MVILVLGGLSTLPLTIAHMYVAVANVTTWEFAFSYRIAYLKDLDPGVNPFHLGYVRNLKTFLCVFRKQNWERFYLKYGQAY